MTAALLRCLDVSAVHVFTCAFDLHDDVTVVDFAFLRANMVKIPEFQNKCKVDSTYHCKFF